MVINRNFGWPNLNLGGALTKSGGTSVHIVRLSKREIVGSLTYLPFFLSRIRLTISVPVFFISDAVHCKNGCSALQPLPQCTASSTLIHATFPASTCDRPCKYLREKTPLYRNLFPHVFLLSHCLGSVETCLTGANDSLRLHLWMAPHVVFPKPP